MGYAQKANEMRTNALQAFTQSFAILSRAMAVTVIFTDQDPDPDSEGRAQGRTRQFTVTLCDPMSGLAHMLHGAEIVHDAHQEASRRVEERLHEMRQKDAEKLETPEGQPEGEPDVPS
jgi:hypothetical protein